MEKVIAYITMHENNNLSLIQHMVFMKDELKLQTNQKRKIGRPVTEHRDRQFTVLILIEKGKYLSGRVYSHKNEKINFREIPFIKYNSWKECKCHPLLPHLKTERDCPKSLRHLRIFTADL